MDSLTILYQSHYEILIKRREGIVSDLADVNRQITDLMREAKAKKVLIAGLPLSG